MPVDTIDTDILRKEVSPMEVRSDPDGLKRLFVFAPEFDAEVEIYGECPVQGFGSVLGRNLYFRARNGVWSFDVADCAGNLPSDGHRDSDGFYREGNYDNSCWMPLNDAVKLITRCLEQYTGVRADSATQS
jgi:hypothetical protein